MKITSKAERASILIIALLSITVMTLICATSLYVTSQNAQTGMQTASWQQALTGAESGVDAAIRALNTPVNAGGWTNWKTVTGTLPAIEPPSGTGSNATAAPQPSPSPGQYNYLPSSALSLTMQGEGATGVSAWVTVDTAGMSASPPWYRVRATGQSAVSGPHRVSANKL